MSGAVLGDHCFAYIETKGRNKGLIDLAHELQWGNLMKEVVVFSNLGYFECVLKLYLSNFLHSEIMMHSLRNPLIIEERWVCVMFSRSYRWMSVEMVDIND